MTWICLLKFDRVSGSGFQQCDKFAHKGGQVFGTAGGDKACVCVNHCLAVAVYAAGGYHVVAYAGVAGAVSAAQSAGAYEYLRSVADSRDRQMLTVKIPCDLKSRGLLAYLFQCCAAGKDKSVVIRGNHLVKQKACINGKVVFCAYLALFH